MREEHTAYVPLRPTSLQKCHQPLDDCGINLIAIVSRVSRSITSFDRHSNHLQCSVKYIIVDCVSPSTRSTFHLFSGDETDDDGKFWTWTELPWNDAFVAIRRKKWVVRGLVFLLSSLCWLVCGRLYETESTAAQMRLEHRQRSTKWYKSSIIAVGS